MTALRDVPGSPLAAVASSLGFYDQAHLTADLQELTGCAPSAWRGTH